MLANKTLIGKRIQTIQGEQECTIHDVNLSLSYPQETIIEREVNGNCQFMLRILPEIATEICQQLHIVPRNEPIYLVMDNAGGHRKQEAREEYTRRLRDGFNIVIIQQSACSPEVSALDLGIWMSVQSAVEYMHQERRRDPDGLSISVQEASQHLLEDTIHWVFKRIPIALRLIVDCGGDNINVEERRGEGVLDST